MPEPLRKPDYAPRLVNPILTPDRYFKDTFVFVPKECYDDDYTSVIFTNLNDHVDHDEKRVYNRRFVIIANNKRGETRFVYLGDFDSPNKSQLKILWGLGKDLIFDPQFAVFVFESYSYMSYLYNRFVDRFGVTRTAHGKPDSEGIIRS